MQCEFIGVTTQDGIDLQGLLFTGRADSDVVGVWVHGLSSNFHSNYKRTTIFARQFIESGLSFATFATRGHDIVASGKKYDLRKPRGYRSHLIGTAYERFEFCVFDIDAIVSFLRKRFKKVILLGHSTGANKVVYYASRNKYRTRVDGVVMLSPVSDVPGWKKELGKRYDEVINYAVEAKKQGKEFSLMPQNMIGDSILTVGRFLSLADQKSPEQMFPTKDFRGPLNAFFRIKVPVLLVVGDNDRYLDLPIIEYCTVFSTQAASSSFEHSIIPGADHSFEEKEEECARRIIGWIVRTF